MPFAYTSATADLGILEGRLTAARAAALDELLAANLPADIAAIDTAAMRGTDGVDVAAMRGTDVALLAASYLGHQMTHYAYGGNLAQNTSFIPPSGTVVTLAHIDFNVIAENDWIFWIGAVANQVVDSFVQDEGMNKRAMNAWMVCDGTDGFRNNTAGAQDILLRGVTLA